jgi:hypothetical protein
LVYSDIQLPNVVRAASRSLLHIFKNGMKQDVIASAVRRDGIVPEG